MGIKILHSAQETEYDVTGISVDIERKTGVLIRQSRKKSEKNHYESRLRQEAMIGVAVEIRGDETEYKKLNSEHQKKMIRKVIKEIKLNSVSSHLFLLHITWEDGIAARTDVALLWRGTMSNTNEELSKAEEAAFRAIYPYEPQAEVMKAFPRFSWYVLVERAYKRGIRCMVPRQGPFPVNPYHRTMSYQDLESVAGLVEGQEEKARMQGIANELAKGTLRGKLSAHWWLPIDGISYLNAFEDTVKYCNENPKMTFDNALRTPPLIK